MLENAFTTKIAQRVLREENEKIYFKSSFKFLSSHNGIRPGKVHVLLGVPGGGKSTVTRSVQIDTLEGFDFSATKCLCWLSEESSGDFRTQLSYTGYASEKLKRMDIFSELQFPLNASIRTLIGLIMSRKYSMVFLDNITTSKFYAEKTPKEQAEIIGQIKKACAETDTPIFIVAHTASNINETITRLITANDVRGSRAIVNFAEFWYTLQNFNVPGKIFPTVRLEKTRGQDVSSRLFFLQYVARARIYTGDQELSFEDFKNAYKKRNQL